MLDAGCESEAVIYRQSDRALNASDGLFDLFAKDAREPRRSHQHAKQQTRMMGFAHYASRQIEH